MGRWGVAAAPGVLKTLLGSCVGVVLYERQIKIGGIAHIVLPDSRGATDQPGKYVDTAIVGLLAEMEQAAGRKLRPKLTAKLFGGASMFQSSGPLEIGKHNKDAAEKVLAGLGIPIVACDMGGDAGRHLTFDTSTGIVAVRIPGGADYQV